MKKILGFLGLWMVCILLCVKSNGQSGKIYGKIQDALDNQSIPFANILLSPGDKGTTSDESGFYSFNDIEPGIYTLQISFVGYERKQISEIRVGSSKPVSLNISLNPSTQTLGEVEVQAKQFKTKAESPLSLRTISAVEIFRNPGGNRDISRVIQVLPGVATSLSFRNDLIVRGGAPNENRFYLDGIEVPNINHFATQGSSGGPVGLLNVNFIREVDFYTGAFPANRGNALSSVLELRQISGNKEKLSGTFMVGSSDVGLTLDGPSGENSSFIFSLRRSYLQFLFQALGLPFLPTYNDFQYKHDFDLDAKNRLTLIGLGAIDQFKLNTSVNDGITDPEVLQRNNYILGNLPVNEQWNYTIGAKWTHFGKDNNQVWVLSRSHLNNSASKYQNNTEQPENLVLDYNSEEIENNFRYEYNTQLNQWNINAGLSAALLQYTNKTTNVLEQNGELALLNYESTLDIFEYAPFFQASRKFLSNRLSLSMGFRLNGLAYNEEMAKPFKHLSPRLSASYAITEKLYWNNNLARYYQIPPLTALGYRDNTGSLVNKTQMDFIENDQVVSGLEYRITDYAKISVEGFYKKYRNYPLSLNDSISLANLGADFGVIGTEPLSSTSEGRSYGLELFIQQKLSSSVYGLISYTYVHSEFENGDNNFVPASWDNRHILNLVAGKKLKKNWEFGLKFRLLGGAPYTPVDVPLSTQKQIWNVTRQGIPDWSRINSERLPVAHALDVRIDKIWYFKKWSINAYIDVQNVYNYVVQGPPFLDVERDAQGNPIEDPMNPSRYQSTFIENQSGTVLPSIGLMLEW